MKKTIFAVALLSLQASAAFAENPFVGEPEAVANQDKVMILPGNPVASVGRNNDYATPAAMQPSAPVYHVGSAHHIRRAVSPR